MHTKYMYCTLESSSEHFPPLTNTISSYVVYGPLANGGTSLLFEATPTFPDPGRYWRYCIQHW